MVLITLQLTTDIPHNLSTIYTLIVGQVLDTLEATGTTNETVVFFAGDNGPAPGQHGIMYVSTP